MQNCTLAIYIAATFARKNEALEIENALKDNGYMITSTWLHQENANMNNPTGVEQAKLANSFGDRDEEEVAKCDVLLMLTGDSKDIKPTGGGRHTEFGIARALKKRCVLLGPRENVFHHAWEIESVSTMKEALLVLAGMRVWHSYWKDAH